MDFLISGFGRYKILGRVMMITTERSCFRVDRAYLTPSCSERISKSYDPLECAGLKMSDQIRWRSLLIASHADPYLRL